MTLQQKIVLESQEKHIRESLEQIAVAKRAGVHQQSLNKMISWVVFEKALHDDMKRRFEGNDE